MTLPDNDTIVIVKIANSDGLEYRCIYMENGGFILISNPMYKWSFRDIESWEYEPPEVTMKRVGLLNYYDSNGKHRKI